MALSQPQLVELNSKMNQVFSLDEIESLCFEMGIDFDSLGGEGRGAKIRELIEFCRRRGRDEELLAKVRLERPQVAWPGAATVAPAGGGNQYIQSGHAEGGGTVVVIKNPIVPPQGAQPGVGVTQTVGSVTGGPVIGAAIGALGAVGALYVNQPPQPKKGEPTALRLDVAVPETAVFRGPFVLAVAVRQPSSPRLTESEPNKLASADALVDWPTERPHIQLRAEILAPDCEIIDHDRVSFRLFRGRDSAIYKFSLMPKVVGSIDIIVNLFQEDESLGSASVSTTVGEEPVGRVRITTHSEHIRTFIPRPKKITILFLAANPKSTDRLRLDEEVRTIDERLRLAQYRDRFNLEQQWAVRTRDILDAMLRYQPDIVHFSGHGSTDGALIFEDASGAAKPVSAAALGALFEALEGVRCVVMNACWSATHTTQITKHVDCAIGMARSVSDDTAIGFAAGFYRSLGEGKSVAKAFDLGKVQIMLDGGSEQSTPRLKSRSGVNPGDVTFA